VAESILPPRRSTADRVAVVVNGNAKGVTKDIVAVLDQLVQSGDLYVSRSLEEGEEIARIIVERGYGTVLTGGGDGTFSLTVTWVSREAARQGKPLPRFGLLKLGTGNALAWVIGATNTRSRGVFADLARLRREGGSRSLRLIEVEGRLAPFAGLGSDAMALKHFNEVKSIFRRTPVLKHFATGGVAYGIAIAGWTIPELLLKPRFRSRIVNEGEPAYRLGPDGQPVGDPYTKGQTIYEGTSRMVIMSTVPYWGFGARIFPFADDREDRFSLRVVDIPPTDALRHLRGIWKGTHRDPRVHDFLVERVSIHHDEPMPLQVGGDAAGDHKVVHAGLWPQPIEVVDYYGPPPMD